MAQPAGVVNTTRKPQYETRHGSVNNCSVSMYQRAGTVKRHNVCKRHVIIEGFHVTPYQANFASRPTHDGHDGFLWPKRV